MRVKGDVHETLNAATGDKTHDILPNTSAPSAISTSQGWRLGDFVVMAVLMVNLVFLLQRRWWTLVSSAKDDGRKNVPQVRDVPLSWLAYLFIMSFTLVMSGLVVDINMTAQGLTFVSTVCSDFALIPCLFVMAEQRRHFELFIGVSQVVTAFCYNTCNALQISLFLDEEEWHMINNVLATTYVPLLAIHIMDSENETLNLVLRYAAFSCILIGQIRDGFFHSWQWTAPPVAFFVLFPLLRRAFHFEPKRAKLDVQKFNKGTCCAAVGAVCFLLGLHDKEDLEHNPFRLWHSLFHWFIGAALWHLWAIVPVPEKPLDDRYTRLPIPKSASVEWC